MKKFGEQLFIEDSENVFKDMESYIEEMEIKVKESVKEAQFKQITPTEYKITSHPMPKRILIQVWCFGERNRK